MKDLSRKEKVLIVDDVPGNIKFLVEILKDEYDIFMATKGQDAVDIALSNKPDLVLLDVIMPEMDGYEVCKKLKENSTTRDIPIIFVTAQDDDTQEAHGLQLGAVDYINKPAKPAILKARVKNHIETKRQRDSLEKLSIHDSLTGIANRRHFDSFLDQEWRRGIRGSLGLAIIMLDIDHFKKYNDYFGHGAGDECLKKVASVLENSVKRSTDLLARYGGEEFVAVLPQVQLHGAEAIAKKMRRVIADLKIDHPTSETADYLTISLGCASIFPTRGSSWKPLLKAADEMLYSAKNNGRNQYKSIVL
ncbi:MAG: PleD family two-component system response regulator [Magnetococcales bacterium]|nr:PleD family two-component system response regulator [Magnetococcales bacterium]